MPPAPIAASISYLPSRSVPTRGSGRSARVAGFEDGPRACRISVSSIGLPMQAELLEPVVERLGGDAEQLDGPPPVAVCLLQRAQDVVLLRLQHHLAQRTHACIVAHACGQMHGRHAAYG